MTGHWKRVKRETSREMFKMNRITVANEKLDAGVFYESLSVFQGITSRNDKSSLSGHAAEPEASSQTPSNKVSPPSTTTAPSPTTGWTPPDYPYRWPTPHRNLVNERLQTANIARSVSPPPALRSPLTHGSPLAPASPRVSTYYGMGQQQEERTAQVGEAQHRYQREPTKTTSPKDALLDYTDTNQPSLFQDPFPTADKQHSAQFTANFFSGEDTSSVDDLSTSQLNMTGFPRDIGKVRPPLSKQGDASSLRPTGDRTTHSTPTSLGSGSSTATPNNQLQSTSPQHTGPDLSHDYASPPRSQISENCFVITGPPELTLLYLRMEHVGRTRPRLRITLEGNWASIESLFNDFPKDVHFNPVWIGPDWARLWREIMATMTARPPRMLAEMWNGHRYGDPTIMSVWSIDFESTEEGIVVHWKFEWSLVLEKPTHANNGVRVDER